MGFGSSRHAYSNSNCNADCKQYANCNVHANCNCNGYNNAATNPDGDLYSHSHAYGPTHSHTVRPWWHGDFHSDSNDDSDGHSDSHGNAHAHADSETHAPS